MRFLTCLVDLVILNVMTVALVIPLFTAGASLTAMNYVLFHMKRKDMTYVVKMFRKSFRDNLRQGIPEGLIAIAAAVITAVDLWALHASDSRLITLMMIVIAVIAGFIFAVFVYLFALQSRYENPVTVTAANALRLAVANLPRTVLMMVIWIIWILIMVILHRAAPLAIVLFGFTLPGYLCTMLYEPVFVRLEEE